MILNMTDSLELKLAKRFSFASHVLFEHGDGWYDILYNLFEKIEKELHYSLDDEFCILQVKEKFGTLNVYTSMIPNGSSIFDYIYEAEQESKFTCEICGSKEKVELRGRCWFQTLCFKCFCEKENSKL